jgi:hypothetical protein
LRVSELYAKRIPAGHRTGSRAYVTAFQSETAAVRAAARTPADEGCRCATAECDRFAKRPGGLDRAERWAAWSPVSIETSKCSGRARLRVPNR